MPDAGSFEGFYREHLARIVRACALVMIDRAAAEDVAAEAFARLWSHWGRIRGDDHAGGYVFKTAMRLAAREVRRRGRPAPVARAGGSELDPADTALSRRDVAVALSGLPMRQRQAVVLRDWAGFETSEVAAMLGMRESTVRVHLSRARERLRAALSVEERERNG
ncbi:MAG: sigma-70 family RNA polymerase sigma factor [Actinobacteria bacterium]|nr:sigma-70 family RNA polymerase sigma factor [Actinomycetota bacterium]